MKPPFRDVINGGGVWDGFRDAYVWMTDIYNDTPGSVNGLASFCNSREGKAAMRERNRGGYQKLLRLCRDYVDTKDKSRRAALKRGETPEPSPMPTEMDSAMIYACCGMKEDQVR